MPKEEPKGNMLLSRLVLIFAQLTLTWWWGLELLHLVPLEGHLLIAAFVFIVALLVWLIGVIGAEVLKEVARPSGDTFISTLVAAAIAALLPLIPFAKPLVPQIQSYIPFFQPLYLPVVGAVIGYQLQR